MKTYNNLKNKLLKDKAIKKAYDELGPEFAVIRMIIKKRTQRGLTQQQLANKLGTKQPVISRLEQGTYNPSVKFLQRVAHALEAELHISIY
jgi:predicted transcriptional regulator